MHRRCRRSCYTSLFSLLSSSDYSFLDVSVLMVPPYVSRSSAVHHTLQTLAPSSPTHPSPNVSLFFICLFYLPCTCPCGINLSRVWCFIIYKSEITQCIGLWSSSILATPFISGFKTVQFLKHPPPPLSCFPPRDVVVAAEEKKHFQYSQGHLSCRFMSAS